MISVLCPSRNRVELLDHSLTSLLSLVGTDTSYEVCVAADVDDVATQKYAKSHGLELSVSERYGYHRMNDYYNDLARMAHGEWLLLWNDDALMSTPGWNAEIQAAKPGVLKPRTNMLPLNIFPVVYKPLVTAVGHMSLSPHVDTWLDDVGVLAGCQYDVDIDILHDGIGRDLPHCKFDRLGRAKMSGPNRGR